VASVQARRALVLFGLMSVIWGIPYLLIRVAVGEISPATLVFARTGIATVVLLPIALLRTDFRAVLRRWRWVVAFAVAEVGVPWVLLGSAEQHVTSSLAGLLVAGVPLVGTFIALGSGSRDRVGLTGAIGLLVGLAGVAAIIGVNLGSSDTTALLEMGVVVIGYAVGPAILSRRLAGLSSVAVMAFSLSLCAIVYAPIAVLQRPATVPSADVLVAVAILGVVCTALAFVLFSALIDEIGPVRATVITYINPAVAAVLGVVVLSERFTIGMAIGLGFVILGSTLATRRPRVGPTDSRRAIGEGLAGTAETDDPAV
jgi:drug/metabolite transporter (DMT)-like permease